jgi:hypothetical protein
MQVEVTMFPGRKIDVDPAELPELRMLGILVEDKNTKSADKPAEKEGK